MLTKKSYIRGVSEIFGYPPSNNSKSIIDKRYTYQCPFLKSICIKPSQHRDYDSNIPFGACSVWHRGIGVNDPTPYVICPVRFTQSNQIFHDASKLFKNSDSSKIAVCPEISLPIGRLDYIVSQYNPNKNEVTDFIILEVMACSTTSTGDVLKSLHNHLNNVKTIEKLKYGINFRQVISRMMVQVLAKAHACEKWKKPLVWAVQDVLFKYMCATTRVKFNLVNLSDIDLNNRPEIVFFSYKMNYDNQNDLFNLEIDECYTTSKTEFSKILEPIKLPESTELVKVLLSKITNDDSTFILNSL